MILYSIPTLESLRSESLRRLPFENTIIDFFCEATLFRVLKDLFVSKFFLKGLSNKLHLAPLGPQYDALVTFCTTNSNVDSTPFGLFRTSELKQDSIRSENYLN